MESCSQLYTRKIVDSIIHGLEQRHSSILFVKYYNTLNISIEDIEEAVCKSKSNIELLYHEYDSSKMQRAYEPFLDWIKQLYFKYYNDIPLDEFLEKCDVYYLSRSAIKTYITDGECKRDEEIIVVETEYERKQFTVSISRIFSYIAKEHILFFVLNRLHLVENSTLNFLSDFINCHADNISLLANYNEAYAVPAYTSEIWSVLVKQIEENNYMLDWNMQDLQATANMVESFEPVLSDFSEYLVLINNMIETLATKQAMYYLDLLYNKIVIEKVNISAKNKMKFFILYADAALLEQNITVSLMMCEKMKNINNKHPSHSDIKYTFAYYYMLTQCQIYGGQTNLAKKNVEQCRKIAKKTNSEIFGFYSEMLYYTVILDGWANSYRWDRCDESEKMKTFGKLAKKYHKYNHLAHILFFACNNGRENYVNDSEKCENQESFQEAMKIAGELKNERLMIAAWRKNVFMAQGYGCFSYVDYYYKKCLEIIEYQNNKSEEASIYNGLGFNRIQSEQFTQANEYFNKALLLFYNLKDAYYVAETLYNMATNAMLAEEYEVAYDCLLRCIKLLESIKQHSMKICNISKIYGMMVICNYKMGIEYNANFYLNKMERVLYHLLNPDNQPNFFLWDDDMFFYYFTSGLLAKSESIEQAQEYFDKARFHMFRSEGLLFFVYAMFAAEQADLYELQDRHEDATDILNSCMEFCNKKGYKHKEEILFAKLHNQPLIHKHISLPISTVTKYQLDEMTKSSEMKTMLENKTRGINFLITWQELLNKEHLTADAIIENSMVTIQNNYNIDCIIYVDIVDGKPVLKYNGSGFDITDEILERLTKYLKKYKKEFVVSRFEREFYEYKEVISVFGINSISSIACIPLTTGEELSGYMIACLELHDNMTGSLTFLEREDITIFKFALRQMSDTLYRLKARDEINEMNYKLQQSAVTDLLTGLLNRQGFAKKMEDHLKAVKRGKEIQKCASVLYIDLDNFKFCNDTFGHDVGDAILIAFSRLFERTMGDKGYIARYGGDEFVMVLPGYTVDVAVEIAKAIYKDIEETQSFKSTIEKITRREISVPEENRLSCSIGIAFMKEYNNEYMNIALKHADTMLYDVKKHQKSDYHVWEEKE